MVRSSTMPSPNPHDKVKNTWKRDWARNKTVYLVFVPVAIYIIVTHYLPMFGIVMAFQDFSLSKGVFGSTFVGPDNFVELFTGDAFLNAFKNTAIMAAFSLVLGFFPGLIFALMLSEVRNKTFKRTIQMISYLPNFVAAVVVTNLVKLFLGNDGPLTALLTALGLPQQNWLANANPPVFWLIHTFMGIWQSLGFGSILLMSAIANINGDIVEAAAIDGATRMQRILRITIPCIAPILGMSFVLNIAISFRTIGGNVLLLYMPQTYSVADCLYTYTHRMAFGSSPDMGLSAASNLFQSVLGTVLLIGGNVLAVGYDADGHELYRNTLATARSETILTAVPNKKKLIADGEDFSFIDIAVTDRQGIVKTWPERVISIQVDGAGTLAGFGSANPVNAERFDQNHHTTYQGRLQAVIRSARTAGNVRVMLSAEGLEPVTITIPVKEAAHE